MNLCTDLLLNAVAGPEQIAGFSPTASDPAYSAIADEVGGIPVHNGSAEAVIRLRPDVIVAPQHMQGVATLLERLGHRVTRVALPSSLSDIAPAVRRMGELLGQPQRADLVIERFEASKKAAAQTYRNVSALIVGPNRYATGRKAFRSEVVAAMGLSSAAPFDYSGSISLEQLIMAAPDVLIIDDSTSNQHSLAQSFKRHPALQKVAAHRAAKQLSVRSRDWLCPGPYVVRIWRQLEAAGD